MSVPPGESAALLQLILDHAGEGISVFDAQLRLRVHNQRFLDCTGLEAAPAQPGAELLDLLRAMALAGEFGLHADDAAREAICQRRLVELRDGPPGLTHRVRPNGHALELRRTPTPGGGFVMLYADVTQQRAAESSLLQEQRMLQLVLQTTAQGFWFIDTEQRTLDANPAMCRMLGLAREALVGRSIFEFVDEANAETFRRQTALRAQGQVSSYEISLRSADGRQVDCFNNVTPIYDGQGRRFGALGLITDITPLKKAQQELNLTSSLLAQKSHVLEVTLDSLAQGVLSVDAHGQINAWNQRFLQLMEVPAEVMAARPGFLELCRWQIDRGLLPQQPLFWPAITETYQRTRPDGLIVEVQTHVATDGGIVRTYTDITAATQASRALRESESRFRTLADGAPALIWQSDREGRALWFNQRWLKITGRTLSQELVCTWAQRMHSDDQARCLAVLQQARDAVSAYHVEFRLPGADGQWLWIADQGVPLFGSDGEFEGFVVYGWDITTRKQAETALLKAKEEAERANRAKSEFLSRMSHELRTPLNAVLGFAQLLQTDPVEPLSATQASRMQELMHGGRHLLSLINDVLDLSRIEAGALHLELVPVALGELVGDCLRLVAPAAAERQIVLSVAPESPATQHVLADPIRLRQVVLNLLSNAVKYNRDGGRVRVSWKPEAASRTVCVSVADTGPGLDEAQQARLFQVFERLEARHSAVEGAGIGLALSKWLVSLMQGELGVDSHSGQGSRFWVRLNTGEVGPVATLPAPPSAEASSLPAVAAKTHTVLHIEDNPVNQVLMEGMLAHRPGVRLLTAGLPETGLAMALQAQPELVLLDIQLPGFDGYEVLRRLRADARTAHIPVIAVSANAMPSDLQHADAVGFADYLTKPLDLSVLLAAVAKVID